VSTVNPIPQGAQNVIPQGASLTDILTAVKNLVLAINALTQTMLNLAGLTNAGPMTSVTVVKATAGRVCEISILSAGTTVGYIYDAASPSQTSGAQMIPLPNIVGVYKVTYPFDLGILVIPGNGQTVSLSYS
jgi:hypothetical protein